MIEKVKEVNDAAYARSGDILVLEFSMSVAEHRLAIQL